MKFLAQLGKIDVYRTEQHERFAFGFVLHPHDGNRALVSSGQGEEIDNFAFDCFMRHHFATDL